MKADNFFQPAKKRTDRFVGGKKAICSNCGLYKDARNPRIEPFGNFRLGIMNVGEAPGEEEDIRAKPWQGKVGKKLSVTFRKLGIDLFDDCININAANCRPVDSKGNNRPPNDFEIECCRRRVFQAIEQYKPKVIILHGGAAVKSVIGSRWKKDLGGITKWRGWAIPDRDLNAWICPVFHPSFVDRQSKYPEVETVWLQDLKYALSKVSDGVIPQFEDEKTKIQYIWDQGTLEGVFGSLALGESELVAFDYETTGLKPHAKGHRIVCCAVATGPNHAYAFMMPTKKHERVLFRRFLASKEVAKAAHNMKFEQNWSVVRAGGTVNPWVWDSMQAAHILDNRKGITSLKFQAYINFGVVDYDSEIAPYLQGKDQKNGNSFNRIYDFIDKFGEEKLLEYCGLDALFEYKLMLKQMENLNFNFTLK